MCVFLNSNYYFGSREFTYHLHLEAVNSIIILFSVHLFAQQPAEKLADKSQIFR